MTVSGQECLEHLLGGLLTVETDGVVGDFVGGKVIVCIEKVVARLLNPLLRDLKFCVHRGSSPRA